MGEVGSENSVLIGKPIGNKPVEEFLQKWENNIKM